MWEGQASRKCSCIGESIEMWEGQASRKCSCIGELAERSPPCPLPNRRLLTRGPFASYDRLLFLNYLLLILYILPLNGLVSYSFHVPSYFKLRKIIFFLVNKNVVLDSFIYAATSFTSYRCCRALHLRHCVSLGDLGAQQHY